MKTNINNTIVVLGSCGLMGKAIVDALTRLKYNICCIDNRLKFSYDVREPGAIQRYLDSHTGIDGIISALPYYLNYNVAQECIKRQIPYFDLGGNVETSNKINQLAKSANSLVLTDLGLAPGLVNIIALYLVRNIYRQHTPEEVIMMSGGIPIVYKKNDPVNYHSTWSITGLINEYKSSSRVLRHGKITTMPSLEYIHHEYEEHFESAITSGGAAHSLEIFQNMGIANCEYRTLRWPGHFKTMKWLLSSNLPEHQIRDILKSEFQKSKKQIKNTVYIIIKIKYKNIIQTYLLNIIDDDNWTAMQKCTGFGCVAAVHDILENKEENKNKGKLDYTNIQYDNFVATLSKIDTHLGGLIYESC